MRTLLKYFGLIFGAWFLCVSVGTVQAQETNWEKRITEKQAAVDSLRETLKPIVSELSNAFEKHGEELSVYTTEEWKDAQHWYSLANSKYEEVKKRLKPENYNQTLYLELEEVWQLYVKAGSAGVRTKFMVDRELKK